MKFNITFAQAKTHVDEFIFSMQSLGYKESTQKIVAQNIRYFLNSTEDGTKQLTENSIYEFLNRYDRTRQRTRFNSVLGSCQRLFNYLYSGDFHMAQTTSEPFCLPEQFNMYLGMFVAELSTKNCKYTLEKKRKAITNFFMYLLENDIKSFVKLNGTIVLNYLQRKTPETRAYIRSFLRYLFSTALITRDLSVLIITGTRAKKLPTVYSEEEICSLISTFEGNSLVAKRNKAIVQIAATTGIRSCDIVKLKYSDFCFEKKCVDIVQIKTGVPLSLLLNTETASAVTDYHASRPASTFENLFINQNAPFNPVSTGIIRYILRNAFAAANIHVAGRKCGPHSLRSSLASAMVNSGVPYEMVQRQLGHTSGNSLGSYIRFDIEKLRVCSLKSQPAIGNFKQWLEGCI